MKTKRHNSVLIGVAGEYLAAGELSRRGYIASITMRNSKGVDILVSNQETTKTRGIQVKTGRGTRRAWVLSHKAENYFAPNLYYVFVNLNNGKPADFYIVPSKVVAKFIKKEHSDWLKALGKRGQKHHDNPMRIFKDKDQKYLNRWDLLKL